MPPADFEPATPETEWTETHALDRSATGIGWLWLHRIDLLGSVIVVETCRRNLL